MNYKHTQIGHVMILTVILVTIVFGFIFTQLRLDPINNDLLPNTIILLFVILLVASFATLTVSIDENYLRIKFGYGIYRKKFLLKEMASVKTVKNHWYYGWGIRIWLKPYMRIFNVSGFDAVEIVMKNGKIYRIGTDEPQKLESILIQHIQ